MRIGRRGKPRSGPDAFTLVEVCVAICIIAVLAALTLTGIQYARHAALRIHCSNNLRQIGAAVAAYTAAHDGVYPGPARGYSLYTGLLPHIEQMNLYNSINHAHIYFDQSITKSNSTVRMVHLEVFVCPADRLAARGGQISYAGNSGSAARDRPCDGIFEHIEDRYNRVQSVTDGSSSTSLVAEWLVGDLTLDARLPPRTVLRLPFSGTARPFDEPFSQACSNADARRLPAARGKGADWLKGRLGNTQYNHMMGLNRQSCIPRGSARYGAYSAGSLHGDGGNVLFADGHAQFLKQEIDLEMWKALGTRNGGDPVPDVLR